MDQAEKVIGPSCVSVIDHPVTMAPVAPREVRNSVPASLGFLPHNHNVFAACHTRLDPKGVCCPQALAILAGAYDRSGPERIKGRFLWVFRDRPTKSTARPQAEGPANGSMVSLQSGWPSVSVGDPLVTFTQTGHH